MLRNISIRRLNNGVQQKPKVESSTSKKGMAMMEINYEHWTAMDNDWFKNNKFFQRAPLSNRVVMLYLLTNIIREPDKKFKNYSLLQELLNRGFLPVNVGITTMAEHIGLTPKSIYNIRDRLLESGIIIYKRTEKHLTNNIFIVGTKSVDYGEFLFLEADPIRFGGSLNKDTIKFMNDKYMELDFFTRKNADKKTFIEALYPVFIRKNGLSARDIV